MTLLWNLLNDLHYRLLALQILGIPSFTQGARILGSQTGRSPYKALNKYVLIETPIHPLLCSTRPRNGCTGFSDWAVIWLRKSYHRRGFTWKLLHKIILRSHQRTIASDFSLVINECKRFAFKIYDTEFSVWPWIVLDTFVHKEKKIISKVFSNITGSTKLHLIT